MKERVPRSMSRSMRMVSGTLEETSIYQPLINITIIVLSIVIVSIINIIIITLS